MALSQDRISELEQMLTDRYLSDEGESVSSFVLRARTACRLHMYARGINVESYELDELAQSYGLNPVPPDLGLVQS